MSSAVGDALHRPARARISWRLVVGSLVIVATVSTSWWWTDATLRERWIDQQRMTVEELRDQEVFVLETWADGLIADARYWAGDDDVVDATVDLLELRSSQLLSSSPLAAIRQRLNAFLELNQLSGFFVIAPDGTSIASSGGNVGTPNLLAQEHPEVFADLLAGTARVSPPQPTDEAAANDPADIETMFVGAPIIVGGEVVAVFTLRVVPTRDLASLVDSSAQIDGFSWFVFSENGVATTGYAEIEPLQRLELDGQPFDDVITERPIGTNVPPGSRDEVDRIEAWALVPEIGLGVMAVEEGDTAFAVLRTQRRVYAMAAVLVAIVASALAVAAQLGLARSRARADLDMVRHRLRALIDPSPDAILRLRHDGSVLGANEAGGQLIEGPDHRGSRWALAEHADVHTLHELAGRHPLLEALALEWSHVAHEGDPEPATVERLRVEIDGDDVYYRVRWVPLAGSEGEMLAVITDVTAGAQRELELEYLARVDPLTALGNRAAIVGRLDDSLKRLERARPGDGVAVVMIDLDHFKPVNDHYGHAAGDALLVEVGKQLTASLRGHDAVGRIGGDEFMIVCERVAGAIDAESIAARVADRLDGISIVVDSTKVSVVGRVGLAWTTEPTDGASLMAAADERLYAAKRDRSGPRFLIANSAPAGT